MRLTAYRADITMLDVDAIVNAANSRLLPGGGVSGAIHAAAGPELAAACAKIGSCATGKACITPGFRLRARHVIHAVGPVWQGGKFDEPRLLKSAYRESFRLAGANGIKTLAFPAISTGIFGYPLEPATAIALEVCHEAEARIPTIEEVTFACFTAETLAAYRGAGVTE